MTLRFYFDECLPHRLAKGLREFEEEPDVKIHCFHEEFPGGHPKQEDDLPWINVLAEQGHWHIITTDLAYKVPQQRAALTGGGFNVYYLTKGWGNIPRWEIIRKLVAIWPDIKEAARSAKPGDQFVIRLGAMKVDRR